MRHLQSVLLLHARLAQRMRIELTHRLHAALIHRNTLRDSLDRATGPSPLAVSPALRDPDQAARRRALHVDSDGLLYTEAPPLHKFKRESADGDPYSQAERAADAVGRRVLTLPTPLSFLPCGSGHGAEGRSHRKARRQSEMDERASRTSGVSVVVDIVVTEEQCEELPCRAEDDFSFEEDPGSSGSQGSGSPKGRTHEDP